jgi:hypothetical protein
MIKSTMPNMPGMGLSGMGAMSDTLEFVKNLWGSMGIPGMSMPGMGMAGMNIPGMVLPTLSVEEINKKITDLKAVESWLTLNMTMLRSGIQALEVQAATISTLQTMGETFAASINPAAKESVAERSSARTSTGSDGSAGGNGHAASHPTEKLHAAPEPTQEDETEAAALTAPLVNAAAWWNMLQDQFKQAVNTAMTEVPAASAKAADKPKAASKAAPKAKAAAPAKRATTRKRSPAK